MPYPVDTGIFNPEGESTDFAGSPSVFIPTRLDVDKGTNAITKLVTHILREYKDARLYLVKWPRAQAAVRALTNSTQSDRIAVVDFMSRTTIPRFYRGADVLVGQMKLGFGSMIEMEAIGCGLPVVFYDRYDGYGVKELTEASVSMFFDSLVTDEAFRRKKLDEGFELIRRVHDARIVYDRFRDQVKRIVG